MAKLTYRLAGLSRLPTGEQQERREEIREVFRAFWKEEPSEKEFLIATSGIVLQPEMLFIMARGE